MPFSSMLSLLASLATIAYASSLPARITVENVGQLPDGWKLNGRADDNATLKLSLSLHNADQMNTLKQRVLEVSNINSAAYTAHMSGAEVRALHLVADDRVFAVREWLSNAGVGSESVHARRDWVHATLTVAQARNLLDADIGLYSFNHEPPRMRTLKYSLPENMARHISFVHPIANFMEPLSARRRLANDFAKTKPSDSTTKGDEAREKRGLILGINGNAGDFTVQSASSYPCHYEVTPECLQQLYNFTTPSQNSTATAHLGIAGFLEQYPNNNDLSLFLTEHLPSLPQQLGNMTFILINGGLNSQERGKAGGEASLDVQYAIPLAYPAKVSYLSTGGRGVELGDDGKEVTANENDNEPFLEFFEAILEMGDDEVPSVLSISYADDEKSVPTPYAHKVCDLIAAVTARGISVLFASGDGGSRGIHRGDCQTNDGNNTRTTITSFPGSCPWATTVGAVFNSETLMGADFSTGGFSRLFPRPEWQDSAVMGYIERLNGTLDGYYNPRGRSMPDISAVGSEFLIRHGGVQGTVYGTSASTPVLASVIARINLARAQAGKKPLGFLNPALYSQEIASQLTDVTAGTSIGCSWKDGSSIKGWPATEGYDCITGLGVLGDYYFLEQAFLQLP
ncbi:Tripeptidyl-peptidase sed3 [Ceratocystis lukuohia]|uniref:tripeptidyl-peptidase II n=1 Tax=Ceratocystis lukuohia TaxID=2019550 RepID=A0ABR4MNQ2_9PEZI